MEWTKDATLPIESRVRAALSDVNELCQVAGIDRSTWTHWKKGTHHPRPKMWRRVLEACQQIERRKDDAEIAA